MRRADVAMAAGFLLISVVLLREARRLPIWTSEGPGAGFFPFWLSVGVAVSAVIVFAGSLRAVAANGPGGPFIPPHAWKPLLVVFTPMVAIILFLNYLGLYLGGAIYLMGYMWLVGRFRWPIILLVSILVPLALFLIFERWFLMPLPKGILLEYLLYGR